MATDRILVDSEEAAAEVLLAVITYARESQVTATLSPVSATQIMQTGLLLEGDIEGLFPTLDAIPGAIRQGSSEVLYG